MSFTEDNITILSVNQYDGGLALRVSNGNAAMHLQAYIDGVLVAWQSVISERWDVRLPNIGSTGRVFLLAVDAANVQTNLWTEAFPDASDSRLEVKLAQTVAPYLPTDRWRIYRGVAGAGSADTQVFEGDIYPGGQFACGFGSTFGTGGFGWDADLAKGFGYSFGLGEFGIDANMLVWQSEPLPRGTYPVSVAIVDAAGNESTTTDDSIVLPSYARPVRDLVVTSYTSGSDTLVLTWTESKDL